MASRASRYLPVEPASLERRGARRWPATLTGASVRQHGDQPEPATLRDLSAYGCRIETGRELEAGERVWVRLAGGLPIAATVVWSRGGATGCRFDAALPRERVRAMTLGG